MQKSMKRLLSVLAVLALVLTMAPAGILAVETKAALSSEDQQKVAEAARIQAAAATAYADGTCPICGEVEWTTLTDGAYPKTEETSYHYYVPAGFASASANALLCNKMPANSTVCVLLGGDMTMNGRFLFYSENEGLTVNVMGTGTVTFTASKVDFGLLSMTTKNGTMNVYGGTYVGQGNTKQNEAIIYQTGVGSEVNIFEGVTIGGTTAPAAGTASTHNVYTSAGTFNMYGGTIRNGNAVGANGGNMWIGSGAVANLFDGTITGGYSSWNGGNIFVNGTINAGAVEITNGKSPSGGNIALVSGTLVMTDDTIVSNGSDLDGLSSYGGNFYLRYPQTGTSLKGTITGGTAINGGSIYMASGNADISASISGGTARFGANIYITTNDTYPEAGSVTFSGGSTSNGVLDKLGGTSTPYARDIYVHIAGNGQGMTITLANNFTADYINFAKAVGKNKLNVADSWSGSAAFNGGAYYVGGSISDGSATAAYTGTLTNASGHVVPIIADGNGGLKLVDFVVIDAEDMQTGYATAAEALAAADKDLTKRIVTRTDFEMNGEEVVVDAINDVTVTGTGKIFGMDYDNNSYKTSNGWITAPDGVVQPETVINGIRYVALNNAFEEHANAWSFHRVETKLTNVTVNVANAGIYYKAEYKFDEIVKDRIASYGVNVNLEGSTKEGQTSSADMSIYDAESHTLTAKSHGVYGIFKPTNDASVNIENGQIKLCGNPYLAIDTTGNMESSDCPEFTAAESTKMSLADAMEMANEKWEAINEEGKPMLQEFFVKWLEAGAWDADWAAKLTNLLSAEA